MTAVVPPHELRAALHGVLGVPGRPGGMPDQVRALCMIGWVLPGPMWPLVQRPGDLLQRVVDRSDDWAARRSWDREEHALLEASALSSLAVHLRFLEVHQRAALAAWSLALLAVLGTFGVALPLVLALLVPVQILMCALAWQGRAPWGELLEVSP